MSDSEKIYEICIKRGQEYRATPAPERVGLPTEFFFTAYQDAKIQLWDIITASEHVSEPRETDVLSKKRVEALHRFPNNVIAFCADRGRGKTTAMLSFSQALESADDGFWRGGAGGQKIPDVNFEVMAPIDPAAMENSESVLQQVISQLFEKFCKIANENVYLTNASDRSHELVSEKFQRCAQAIDSLYKNPEKRDNLVECELDQTAEMGECAILLLLLHELVESYLKFVCKKGDGTYLVVQIDDADMDIGRSYQILEDVRKYLSLPHVIVLMATNMQQLETTVEQHFLQAYANGLAHSGSMITVERCHEITTLYLEKAIPHTRRIYLPDITEAIRRHLSHLRIVYQDESGQNLLSEDGFYQQQLLDLLYRKTGMVFTSEPEYLHSLLPAHMRELSQFLPFFVSMDDLPDGYRFATKVFQLQGLPKEAESVKILECWGRNLERLEFYLVNLWSAVNLREGSRALFLEAVRQSEPVRNLYLLRNIVDYYVRERMDWENSHSRGLGGETQYRDEFVAACKQRGVHLGSSVAENPQEEVTASQADVMSVLFVLTNLPGAERQYKFAYAVRLFYSIRLHFALIREIRAIGEGHGILDFRTLTQILGDFPFKDGWVGDTERTPFGCWRLKIPAEWFGSKPSANGGVVTCPALNSGFLRKIYKRDNMICTGAIISLDGETGVWRELQTPLGQPEENMYMFNPLYPLLNALDMFVCYKKVLASQENMEFLRSQIYIALLVCLNWDVQRVLFKKVRSQPDDTMRRMLDELYGRYIGDLLGSLPLKLPPWLKNCFGTDELPEPDREVLDTLLVKGCPYPEIRTHVRGAKNGMARFDEAFVHLKELLGEVGADITLKSLWETNAPGNGAAQEALADMETAVQEAFASPWPVNKRIRKEVCACQPLAILLDAVLNEPPTPFKALAITPNQVRRALEHYINDLSALLQQGKEAVTITRGESAGTQLEGLSVGMEQGEDLKSAPALAGASESAVQMLRELIRLGQQFLEVLDSSRRTSEFDAKRPRV